MRENVAMEVFVRVVEKQSFSAAGQALNLTPSAISKQVSRIEAELGVSLLNRSTHELSLTEAGKIYHRHCLKILRDIELARDAAREASEGLKGVLKLHVTPGFTGRHFVLPALRRFAKKYQDVTLQLTMMPDAVDPVEDGFDLSIRSGAAKELGPGNPSVEVKELAGSRYEICASKEYLKRRGRPATPRDLADHDCLLYVGQPLHDRWWFTDGKRRYSVTVNGHFQANDWLAIYDAAREGLGIARVQVFGDRPHQALRGLEILFDGQAICDRAIWALYPRAHQHSLKLKKLLDHLAMEIRAR